MLPGEATFYYSIFEWIKNYLNIKKLKINYFVKVKIYCENNKKLNVITYRPFISEACGGDG